MLKALMSDKPVEIAAVDLIAEIKKWSKYLKIVATVQPIMGHGEVCEIHSRESFRDKVRRLLAQAGLSELVAWRICSVIYIRYSVPGFCNLQMAVHDPVLVGGDARNQEVLEMSIPWDQLSVRSTNILDAEGIITMGHLVSRTEAEILMLKHSGPTAVKEIREFLHRHGLTFKRAT